MSGAKANNPFAPHPDTQLNRTAERYPALDAEQQQPPMMQQQYSQHQPQQQQQQHYMQQQQQPFYDPSPSQSSASSSSMTSYGGAGYAGGQQMGTAMMQNYTGAAGYGQQQQHQQQQYQQQLQSSIIDLDPYANLGSTASSSSASLQQQAPHTPPAQAMLHPKEFIRQQKTLLSSFDPYTWKQLFNRIDEVRIAWEERKTALLDARMRGDADYEVVERMVKEASEHVDSIHASKFQLAEVQTTWRQSADAASKVRVREALNAGINALPEYPPPFQSLNLSQPSSQQQGSMQMSMQRQEDEARRNSIMSGFGNGIGNGNPPSMMGYQTQNQPYGQQQYPQATGYQQPMMQQAYTGYGAAGGIGGAGGAGPMGFTAGYGMQNQLYQSQAPQQQQQQIPQQQQGMYQQQQYGNQPPQQQQYYQ